MYNIANLSATETMMKSKRTKSRQFGIVFNLGLLGCREGIFRAVNDDN
jgi:hypothetical protein